MFNETYFSFMLFETKIAFMLFALMLFGNPPFQPIVQQDMLSTTYECRPKKLRSPIAITVEPRNLHDI